MIVQGFACPLRKGAVCNRKWNQDSPAVRIYCGRISASFLDEAVKRSHEAIVSEVTTDVYMHAVSPKKRELVKVVLKKAASKNEEKRPSAEVLLFLASPTGFEPELPP